MSFRQNKQELNELAVEYFYCDDSDKRARLKNDLWIASWEYLQGEANLYPNRTNSRGWSLVDIISEAAKHMPMWIDRYDPTKSEWTTYIVHMYTGMRRNGDRPGNINHRFHESAVRALHIVSEKGVDPDVALKTVLLGETPEAQEKILEAWHAMQVFPVSLSEPIAESGATLEGFIHDEHSEDPHSHVIDRTSRTPIIRNMHKRHKVLIEQLLDKIPFRHLNFGEPLTLPQKAIRISEAIARLRFHVNRGQGNITSPPS